MRKRVPWRELRGGGKLSMMFVLGALVFRETMAYCSELMAMETADSSVCNVDRSMTETKEAHYQIKHEMANEENRSSKQRNYVAQSRNHFPQVVRSSSTS